MPGFGGFLFQQRNYVGLFFSSAIDKYFGGLLENFSNLFIIKGFQAIPDSPVVKSFSGICKFRISAYNNKQNIPVYCLDVFDKLKSAHARHPNVGKNKVRFYPANLLVGLNTVPGTAHNFKAAAVPVSAHNQTFYNKLLIINNQNLIHTPSASSITHLNPYPRNGNCDSCALTLPAFNIQPMLDSVCKLQSIIYIIYTYAVTHGSVLFLFR